MKILIFLLIMLCCFQCFAQQTISTFKFEKELHLFISSKFDEVLKTNELDQVGLHGKCYIKFSLNKGKITTIVISPSTPEALKSFLKKTMNEYRNVYSLEGYDTTIREFILPVEYSLQKNGKTKAASKNSDELEALKKPKWAGNTVEMLPKLEIVSPFDRGGNSWKKAKAIKNNPAYL